MCVFRFESEAREYTWCAGADKIAQPKIINRFGEAFSPLLLGVATVECTWMPILRKQNRWLAHQKQARFCSSSFNIASFFRTVLSIVTKNSRDFQVLGHSSFDKWTLSVERPKAGFLKCIFKGPNFVISPNRDVDAI
jgi:hypothetical protein